MRYLTLRSDRLDKFAQPELTPGRSSGIGYDAPALRGATNVVLEDAPPSAGTGLVIFTRPRGYIADSFDGRPVPGVAPGIPTSASFRIETTRFDRGLPAVLNGERMMIRAFPGEIVYAEFHH